MTAVNATSCNTCPTLTITHLRLFFFFCCCCCDNRIWHVHHGAGQDCVKALRQIFVGQLQFEMRGGGRAGEKTLKTVCGEIVFLGKSGVAGIEVAVLVVIYGHCNVQTPAHGLQKPNRKMYLVMSSDRKQHEWANWDWNQYLVPS